MPSVFIKTYGCQMNERDSEAVAAQLVAKGYTLALTEAMADVVLLNTCSVRDFAEQKAIGKMQNIAADVRKNRPNVVLGFLGCMAQSRGQELIDKLPDVDLVLGTQNFITRRITSMKSSPVTVTKLWTWRQSRGARR